MMPPVRAVLFDLDGTLTDRAATLRAAGTRLGAGVAGMDDLLRRDPHGRWGTRRVLASLPGVSLRSWRQAIEQSIVPSPHADVVNRLRASGIRVGVVTNGGRATQRAKLRRLRLTFDAVVISGEVGVRKPDERIFRLALARLGVAAADATFVGDDPEWDLAPARRLGMEAWPAAEIGGLENALAPPRSIGLCSGASGEVVRPQIECKETPCIDTET